MQHEPLLTNAEVAALYRVDKSTVSRWADRGKLPFIRTPGGHRRYREADIHALVAGHPLPPRDEHGNLIEIERNSRGQGA